MYRGDISLNLARSANHTVLPPPFADEGLGLRDMLLQPTGGGTGPLLQPASPVSEHGAEHLLSSRARLRCCLKGLSPMESAWMSFGVGRSTVLLFPEKERKAQRDEMNRWVFCSLGPSIKK